MRSVSRSLASFVSCLLLLLTAPSAWAGSIHIDFDLTGSSASLLGGLLQLPPDGSITSASARVTVPGASLTEATSGSAQLSSLQLAATIDATVGGSVGIAGDFTAVQTGAGLGNLAGDLATLDIASILFEIDGTLDCVGGQCVALGTFPVSVTDSLVLFINLDPFVIGGLDTVGGGTLSGALAFNLGGNEGVATLVGQESGRSFVPEPASGMLVGFGLLAAVCVDRRRGPAASDAAQPTTNTF